MTDSPDITWGVLHRASPGSDRVTVTFLNSPTSDAVRSAWSVLFPDLEILWISDEKTKELVFSEYIFFHPFAVKAEADRRKARVHKNVYHSPVKGFYL